MGARDNVHVHLDAYRRVNSVTEIRQAILGTANLARGGQTSIMKLLMKSEKFLRRVLRFLGISGRHRILTRSVKSRYESSSSQKAEEAIEYDRTHREMAKRFESSYKEKR